MTRASPSYVVVGRQPWNATLFHEHIRRFPGRWFFCSKPSSLERTIRRANPRYVFFLHWSLKVPAALVQSYECVCFHMTDVPYGRGGTPLQNLILRGHQTTKLTALRMTGEFDAGPVYLKRSMSLRGRAEEIYHRATLLSAQMIRTIIRRTPKPKPQRGKAVVFHRRTPEQSKIPKLHSLPRLYDFLRMLDAPGYPHAFLDHNDFRYEFTSVRDERNRLAASVNIYPVEVRLK